MEKQRGGGFNPLLNFEGVRDVDPYAVVGGGENDVVKVFDRLCRNAKIATIRDRQKDERKIMENMYINKEKRLDEMMELERLKEINFLERQQIESQKLHKDGNKVVVDQILDNERHRNREREAKERERILMLRQIEKMKEEEEQRNILKRLETQARIREGIETNRINELNKKKRKIEEKEEDLKIFKFNMDKIKQEEDFIKEKKKIALQKEREIQALREKQERATDKLDEMNAIKAKRAYEESEMKAIQKEKEEKMKKQKMMEDVIKANEMALKAKEKIKNEEIMKDKLMLESMIKEQMKEKEEAKINSRIKMEKAIKNRIDIEKQIADREDKERLKKIAIIEEGQKIKAEQENYMNSLEKIRQQKIQELKNLGIKDSYIVPLEKYNYKEIENTTS